MAPHRIRDQGRDRARRGPQWQPVCDLGDLEVDRGAAALVHGQAVALFRTACDEVFALANHDPWSKASTLARGIVGVRDATPFVGSPAHRHTFDLRTGRCREVPHVAVATYEVRVEGGVVLVGPRQP